MKNKLLSTGIVALSFFFSVKTNAQVAPTAAFSLSQPTICAGGTVQVTDASTDSPTAWSYTIDEGTAPTTSILQSPSLTITTAGDYTITLIATNGDGDSAPVTQTLTVKALPMVTASGVTGPVCEGDFITLTGGGASTYTWSDGVADGTAFAVTTGTTYTVTGTDADGCSATAEVTVVVNPLPVLAIAGATAICIGDQATLTVSGADTYTWTDFANTATINDSPLVNTTYSVAGTSVDGCVSSTSLELVVNALPTVTVNSGPVCIGSVFTMVPGGADTYVFSNGSDTTTPTADETYTVTGTDVNGCVATAVSSVTVNALPVVTVNTGTLCEGTVFTLTPSGAVNYSYAPSLTATVSPNATTSYSIVGEDANGCLSVEAVTELTVSPAPVLAIAGATAICVGDQATLTVSGADTYTWTDFANAATINDSPLVNTTYSVAGTSVDGCLSSTSLELVVNALPTVTVNSGPVCIGSVFTMVPGGADTYVFSNGSDTTTPTADETYTVTGTDVNGCVATAVSSVTVNALPVVTVNTGTLCEGTVFTLTPSGAVNYSYAPSLTATVSPNATTSYSIVGEDANGCLSVEAVTELTVSPAPVLSVNSGSICEGETFTITPTSAATLTFSFVNGGTTVSPATSTDYTITGEDALGCRADVVSQLTVVALPVISVNSGSICSGDVFTMTPSGAFSYTFVNGSANVSPTSNTSYSVNGSTAEGCVSTGYAVSDVTVVVLPVVSVSSGSICIGSAYTMTASGADTYNYEGGSSSVNPSSTTSYTVTGVSVEGCLSSNTATSTVNVWSLPVLSISSPTAICSGETANLTVSGASTYTWIPANVTTTSYAVNPTANTTYSVIGEDANGCQDVISQAIVVNTLPVVAVNSGTICPGASFTIIPTGAATYTIQGGTATVTPASTTSYSVTGTDANGCISAAAAISNVNVMSAIVLAVAGNTTICAGETANLTASGATTYSWSTTVITNTIALNPTTTTSYSVTGMTSGCSNSIAVTVSVNALPTVTITSSSSATLCSGESATLTSTGAATYSWDNASTDATLVVNPTTNTTYTVTGTDANSCSSKATFVQNVSECTGLAKIENASVNVGIYPNPTNGEFTITLTQAASVKILNGIGQVVYTTKLTDGDNVVTLNNQPNGIYFVQLTQGNQTKTVKVVKN